MIKHRQCLPLILEPAARVVIGEFRLDGLERHPAAELIIGASGEVDGSHAAAADLAHNLIRAESAPDHRVDAEVGRKPRVATHSRGYDRLLEEAARGLEGPEQRTHFPVEIVVAGRSLAYEAVAPIRGTCGSPMKQRLNLLPTVRRHSLCLLSFRGAA